MAYMCDLSRGWSWNFHIGVRMINTQVNPPSHEMQSQMRKYFNFHSLVVIIQLHT